MSSIGAGLIKKSLDVKRYQYNKAGGASDMTSPSVIMINYIVEGINVLNKIFLEKGLVEKILMDNSITFQFRNIGRRCWTNF